jgi:hypothetical protein
MVVVMMLGGSDGGDCDRGYDDAEGGSNNGRGDDGRDHGDGGSDNGDDESISEDSDDDGGDDEGDLLVTVMTMKMVTMAEPC